jgi:hypothetical protein
MTINTTKEPRADAVPDLAIEPPATNKTQPGLGVVQASSPPDLESRIKLRRAELIVRLRELREDTHAEAIAAGDKLKAKLSQVAHIIKEGVVDGWASLGDSVKHKLEHWLTESARQPPGASAANDKAPSTAGQS